VHRTPIIGWRRSSAAFILPHPCLSVSIRGKKPLNNFFQPRQPHQPRRLHRFRISALNAALCPDKKLKTETRPQPCLIPVKNRPPRPSPCAQTSTHAMLQRVPKITKNLRNHPEYNKKRIALNAGKFPESKS